MAQSICHESPDIRQAAVYGVGAAAKFAGTSYAQFCVRIFSINLESLPHLFELINSPDSRSEENIMATENAISAIGKVVRAFKNSGSFDSDSVISHWIEALPLVEDCEESVETYSFLLELIQSQHHVVVDTLKIPKLISILSTVLSTPSLLSGSGELSIQLTSCLKSLVGACDSTTKQKLWNSFSEQQQKYLVSQQIS
jgi:hypothetical protein